MAGSKKYIGKLCVYCRKNKATTADHVFPREMFQVTQRNMLPKVPACTECNNEKSKIEHYLLSVLPFGATHSNAKKALSIDTKRRLEKNKKLHNQMHQNKGKIFIVNEENTVEKRLTVKFDGEQLHKFIGYVGLGLNWFYWEKYLPLNYSFISFTPSPTGVELIKELHSLSSSLVINEFIGEDTVKCKGIMDEINNGISVWSIQLMGGITIATDDKGMIFKNSFVTMITGKPRELEKLNINNEA
jgi:hypothetical protein